ncbi:hypothetical protein HN51_069301, partial [Arachis hypogaea]
TQTQVPTLGCCTSVTSSSPLFLCQLRCSVQLLHRRRAALLLRVSALLFAGISHLSGHFSPIP